MKKTDLTLKVRALFHALGGMVFVVAALLSASTLAFAVSCSFRYELYKYQRYYQATEILLDSLESNLYWTDAYDGKDAYDNYVNAKKDIDNE